MRAVGQGPARQPMAVGRPVGPVRVRRPGAQVGARRGRARRRMLKLVHNSDLRPGCRRWRDTAKGPRRRWTPVLPEKRWAVPPRRASRSESPEKEAVARAQRTVEDLPWAPKPGPVCPSSRLGGDGAVVTATTPAAPRLQTSVAPETSAHAPQRLDRLGRAAGECETPPRCRQ